MTVAPPTLEIPTDARASATRAFTRMRALPAASRERSSLRDLLVQMHLPLVRSIVRRYSHGPIPYEDLVQQGSIGLLNAIDRYEPERGLAFSTFAFPTIAGEVKRYFRDTGWLAHVPRRAKEMQAPLQQAETELRQGLLRSPTVAELALRLGVAEDLVREALTARLSAGGKSLDENTERDAAALTREDDGIGRAELRCLLWPAIGRLPEQQRTMLWLRYFEDKTQSQIAATLGVSQMHVSRVLAAATRRLRELISGEVADLA